MGQATQKKRERREAKPKGHAKPHRSVSLHTRQLTQLALLGFAIIGLTGVTVWVSSRGNRTTGQSQRSNQQVSALAAQTTAILHTNFELQPETLDELLTLPTSELGRVDIARMNLLCATRLPGTQSLDVEHALSILDEWARKVAFETDRHLYRVHDPRYADRYRGSEAHYRAEMLAQVLQEDLGIKYDMSAVGNFSFVDPNVAFIHGMIPGPGQTTADTPGGTCASMPVLYVAVGRRLGYPLKLSTTDSHIFARWDGLDHPNPNFRERFNCETTNGFHRLGDDFYHTWPKPVTERQIAVNGYLKSLTPDEGMAEFMAARGHHGMDTGQFGFAARCYENAYRYDTTRPAYHSWFLDAAMRSGYRPATPALANLLEQRRHVAAATARHLTIGAMPHPSQTPASLNPHMPVAPRVGGWQSPQSMTPGVPQPGTHGFQPFRQPHQPDLFRSQP